MSETFDEIHQQCQAKREHEFEERIVKHVLTHYRLLTSAKQALLLACEKKTGKTWLKFEFFHERFPDFPILLDARRLAWVSRNLTIPDLFKKSNPPLMNEYMGTQDSYSGWPANQLAWSSLGHTAVPW